MTCDVCEVERLSSKSLFSIYVLSCGRLWHTHVCSALGQYFFKGLGLLSINVRKQDLGIHQVNATEGKNL